ncbi:GNAT family N-acetyltransferase [Hydrogenophaga sp. 5NK40-0174]|uniref:GNAT family N-acetyltransferase n=1 Tax=Hydrogenophaga sp. 5NK40-0174 TaxID=3127649 RepID=UPI00310ADFC3
MKLDVATLERATLSAVPPESLDESLPGWLVPLDSGTVGRARSAVPLSHEAPTLDAVAAVVDRYRQNGLTPALRLPESHTFAEASDWLVAQGFRKRQPTHVMVAALDGLVLPVAAAMHAIRLDVRPDDAWKAVFLGEGFDPVDGACRVKILARALESRYASIRAGQAAVACGMASLGHGWLGIHGMRTLGPYRRQGMASALMLAMVNAAREVGLQRAFLQVDGANQSAERLYERMGFKRAWTYAYWG